MGRPRGRVEESQRDRADDQQANLPTLWSSRISVRPQSQDRPATAGDNQHAVCFNVGAGQAQMGQRVEHASVCPIQTSARSQKGCRLLDLKHRMSKGSVGGIHQEITLRRLVLVIFLLIIIAGCIIDNDQVRVDSFTADTPSTFTYSARTNTVMTENDDGAAKQIRRDWLTEALAANGMCGGGYVIETRRFVQPWEGPFGTSFAPDYRC
jgi:hypothetical protein